MTALLRLHVDRDGLLWYGDDDRLAVPTGRAVAEAVCDPSWPSAAPARVRVLGGRPTAELVYRLQQRRLAGAAWPVFVAAPAVVPTARQRADPAAVLHALWQPPASARARGLWHALTATSFVPVLMSRESAGQPHVPETVRRAARFHPAWPAFAFFGCDQDAACRLACDVLDFRWYAHPSRPGRVGRLCAHLGLTPRNAAAALGLAPPDRHYERAANAVALWRRADPAGAGAWLIRRFNSYADPVRGVLAVTAWLLRLARDLWADALDGSAHPEARFDPGLAVGDSELAAAFARYRAAWRPA